MFDVPGSMFVCKVPVRSYKFIVLGSMSALQNVEPGTHKPGTSNSNPAHEPGTRNQELGTVFSGPPWL
jgi:hypothetical protein